MTQYQGLINSLRNAAAFTYRDPVLMTQGTNSEQDANLIAMTLTEFTPGRSNVFITLWFTADNLYLRGFTNVNGQTFYFNEGPGGYNLATAFYAVSPQFGALGSMSQLGYSSNYNSLTNVAGAGRDSIDLSWQSFYNAFYTLGYYGINSSSTYSGAARSLLLMIQYFSEAARFWDIGGYISNTVQYDVSGPLPLWMQYLENSWARISQYGVDISQNPSTPPMNVTGMNPNYYGGSYTFYSFGDVQRFMAVLLNPGEVNDPAMGGYNGDWNRDEL
jgi:hypothetical protein